MTYSSFIQQRTQPTYTVPCSTFNSKWDIINLFKRFLKDKGKNSNSLFLANASEKETIALSCHFQKALQAVSYSLVGMTLVLAKHRQYPEGFIRHRWTGALPSIFQHETLSQLLFVAVVSGDGSQGTLDVSTGHWDLPMKTQPWYSLLPSMPDQAFRACPHGKFA